MLSVSTACCHKRQQRPALRPEGWKAGRCGCAGQADARRARCRDRIYGAPMDDEIPAPLELVRVSTPDPAERRMPSGLRVVLPAVEVWNRMVVIHYVWPVVPNVEQSGGTIDWGGGVTDEHGQVYRPGPGGEMVGSLGATRGAVVLDLPLHSGTEEIVLHFWAGATSLSTLHW